jgi:hypothetical protein
VLREHLDIRADVPHARRTDEDAAQRLVVAREREIGLEARDLAPIRIPVDDEVDEPEMLAVEDDHPRASPEHRLLEPAHRLVEPVEPHQAHERRRLAAGDHEPVEPFELLRLAHLDDVRAELAQHRRVLAEVALHCEDADRHVSITA